MVQQEEFWIQGWEIFIYVLSHLRFWSGDGTLPDLSVLI